MRIWVSLSIIQIPRLRRIRRLTHVRELTRIRRPTHMRQLMLIRRLARILPILPPECPRLLRPRRTAPAPRRGGGSRGADAEGERLQKVLSRAGLASRREAEDWIRAGRITINGQPAVLGARVSSSDQVRLDGRLIRQRETGGGATAFVVHRSPGESLTQPNSETQSEGGDSPAAAMIERLPTRAGRRFITISPMPRVDGGLELVTSDGELGVRLQTIRAQPGESVQRACPR